MGFWYRSAPFTPKPIQQHQRSSTGKIVACYHYNFDLNNVDCVPSNAKFSRFGSMLCIFADDETMVKMHIKGRSPNTKTRVQKPLSCSWLFDRINLDPKIQINYVDTKHQRADILIKGNFTRDEWNTLLYLFNIIHSSSLSCAQNFSFASRTKTMTKICKNSKENRIVAKSKPTTMNLAVSVSTSSSAVNSPIAWKSPRIFKASCRTDWSSSGKLNARNSDHDHDAASSSQGWQKDALLDGCIGKLVAT